MRLRALISTTAITLVLALSIPTVASAQFGNLGRRLADAVTDQVGDEMENLLRDGVRCAFSDNQCIAEARASGKTPVMTDANGTVMTDADGRPLTDPAEASAQAGASNQKPGTGVWTNYDFVPGDMVMFYDDYTDYRVGDFPRRWDLIAGNWEVVESQDTRYVRATSSNSAVTVDLPATLPERFTIEFPALVTHGNGYIRVSTSPVYHGDDRYQGSMVSLGTARAGIMARGDGPDAMTTREGDLRGDVMVTIRIMADGDYMKVYMNEQRMANVPNAVFPRTNQIVFSVGSATNDSPIMIGPLRIAAGGLDLYSRLERDGRVATQGILFAVNSDVIRPESTPTLTEIGNMLTQHADLRLTIEGHTDSDGDDSYNLGLSQRRAAAVKAYLVDTHNISDGRLTTAGLGETSPVADNGTPEGKQQNRRVELVRQ